MTLKRPSNNTFRGTDFQRKVWNYLKHIKKGTVKTYKQVAIGINRPKSSRAVANAIGKNPDAPKIPCHRVIRSDGSLGGYSGKGGLKTKRLLLKKEGVTV
jgi:methylated-DNA-[protein]-cysteine S-methyltransferase